MKLSVTNRSQTIRENTTLMPEGYGAWKAQNVGTGNVEVDGFILKPGETIDWSNIEPNVVWNTPIIIVCQTGGVLRVARLTYSKEV